jgi:hypothetical protein
MLTKKEVYWEVLGRVDSALGFLIRNKVSTDDDTLNEIYITLRRLSKTTRVCLENESRKEDWDMYDKYKGFDEYDHYGENNPPLKPTEEY